MKHGEWARVRRILWTCTLLAAMHSALASRPLKLGLAKLMGERRRDGLYRFAYVSQSVASFNWLTWWYLHLPDRELYHVPPPWSWLMRLGQAGFLGLGFLAVRQIGIPTFNGLPQVQAYVAGETPRPVPEAQGPPPATDGTLQVAGPYRFVRHPNNLAPLGVLALFPRMTVNRLALVAATAAYAVAGSLHEEYRLRAAYGSRYEQYCRDVPFLVPRLRRA